MTGTWTYAVREAMAGLRRDWRSAGLALLVIAAAVFVTGTLLVALRVADRVLAQLTEAPDLSVFLALDATPQVREDVERVLRGAPEVAAFDFVSSDAGAERLRAAYPDLAPLVSEGFALPASFDVTLAEPSAGTRGVESLVERLRQVPGVDQVRYDQELARRAAAIARIVRSAGITMAAMLALAGALAVFSVVRLAYVARQDEVEILYLVGAPLFAIRGPFLVEGVLQGALGAVLGVVSLSAGLAVLRSRMSDVLVSAIGSPATLSLPLAQALLLVFAASALGAVAAALAWRSASRARAT